MVLNDGPFVASATVEIAAGEPVATSSNSDVASASTTTTLSGDIKTITYKIEFKQTGSTTIQLGVGENDSYKSTVRTFNLEITDAGIAGFTVKFNHDRVTSISCEDNFAIRNAASYDTILNSDGIIVGFSIKNNKGRVLGEVTATGSFKGFDFDGWYVGYSKITKSGTFKSNITFTAKLKQDFNIEEHFNTDLVYNGQKQNLGYVSVYPNDAVVTYKVNGGSYSADLPKARNGGNYTVFYKVQKEGCCTVEQSVILTIGKADNPMKFELDPSNFLSTYSDELSVPTKFSTPVNSQGKVTYEIVSSTDQIMLLVFL